MAGTNRSRSAACLVAVVALSGAAGGPARAQAADQPETGASPREAPGSPPGLELIAAPGVMLGWLPIEYDEAPVAGYGVKLGLRYGRALTRWNRLHAELVGDYSFCSQTPGGVSGPGLARGGIGHLRVEVALSAHPISLGPLLEATLVDLADPSRGGHAQTNAHLGLAGAVRVLDAEHLHLSAVLFAAKELAGSGGCSGDRLGARLLLEVGQVHLSAEHRASLVPGEGRLRQERLLFNIGLRLPLWLGGGARRGD